MPSNGYIPTSSDVSESKYVRKEDIPDGGLVVTITKFSKENLAPEGEPPENKVIIHFDGAKPLVCNSTNWQLLEKGLGKDAGRWIGQQIKLWVDENVSFGGKLVGGVRVKTRSSAPPEPPEPPRRAATADGFADDIPF